MYDMWVWPVMVLRHVWGVNPYLCFVGREILVKAEFLNPGGSVKDRAALFLIKDAQKQGTIMIWGRRGVRLLDDFTVLCQAR